MAGPGAWARGGPTPVALRGPAGGVLVYEDHQNPVPSFFEAIDRERCWALHESRAPAALRGG